MTNLIESRLQKAILLIGGILVFFRLSYVSYRETGTAILQSLGISVLVFVLLVLTRGYKPEIHRKIFRLIKKYWLVLVLIVATTSAFYGYRAYEKYLANQRFHKSEIAYQNCLDKVATQNNEVQGEVASYRASIPPSGYISQKTSYLHTPGQINLPGYGMTNPFINLFQTPTQKYLDGIQQIQAKSYFYQWEQANRPGYNRTVGFWEVAFINWLMQNHPDFCSEFNPSTIESFVTQKMSIIN